MRGKLLATATLSSAISIILTAGACWVWLQVRNQDHWETRGDDPTIIEDQSRIHPSGEFTAEINGTIAYDQRTKCLTMLVPNDVVVENGGGEPVAHPIRAAVVWPKGSRPIIRDGTRGVAVGALLGKVGGDVILDGDAVHGTGQYMVAAPHTDLLVKQCETDNGVIAVFTDPASLSVTRP